MTLAVTPTVTPDGCITTMPEGLFHATARSAGTSDFEPCGPNVNFASAQRKKVDARNRDVATQEEKGNGISSGKTGNHRQMLLLNKRDGTFAASGAIASQSVL